MNALMLRHDESWISLLRSTTASLLKVLLWICAYQSIVEEISLVSTATKGSLRQGPRSVAVDMAKENFKTSN